MHGGYLRIKIHTLRICNTYCFSTATLVTGSRLSVTSYVRRLSCCVIYEGYSIRNDSWFLAKNVAVREMFWKPVACIWCCTSSLRRSNTHKLQHLLVARNFCIYYTVLLHVSAIYLTIFRELRITSTCVARMASCHRRMAKYLTYTVVPGGMCQTSGECSLS